MLARMKWLQIPGIVTGVLIATAAVGFGQSQKPKENPEIKASMESLRKASSELQRAGGGFGGHRGKALEHMKAAEAELQQALQWDKTHADPPKKK